MSSIARLVQGAQTEYAHDDPAAIYRRWHDIDQQAPVSGEARPVIDAALSDVDWLTDQLGAARQQVVELEAALAELDGYCGRGGGDWHIESREFQAGLDRAYADVQRWLRSRLLVPEAAPDA